MSYKLNEKQLNNIPNLSCEERLDYSLKKIADWQEIWILINENQEFLKVYSEEDDIEYLPIWPHPDFAAKHGDSPFLSAKKIPLDTFFDRWIPGLTQDELCVGVFPGADKTVWISEPSEFQEDLEDELSQHP